ncbi:MAG: hypothetical protein RL154_1637 [Pseudomonadota bacterium]|jgi:predicted glycosyltransferase
MIWFDLVTPKSVMFFKPIIKALQERGKQTLVTAREGLGYSEVVELLKLHNIDFFNRGYFGGANLGDKLKASIHRQLELMEFVEKEGAKKLVCLCSVDANRVAFGLGMPIINFYDIPLSDYTTNFKKALPQARLTLPLSNKAFRPFMVPNEIFNRFGLEDDQIFEYKFLDVVAWLHDFVPSREFYTNTLKTLGLDINKPTIVIREEEYKASYVMKKYPFLYDGLRVLKDKIDANFLIIPRYEPETVAEMLPFCAVLQEKIVVQHLLAYCDLFIGGGGTLNSEACYFGAPTISTRSFISHYDKFLIDEGLMLKADSADEVVDLSIANIGKKQDANRVFDEMNFDVNFIVDEILK